MADWSLLPALVVVELLSYLPLTDKLSCSSTCKNWRSCLFYPSLWNCIHYRFNRKGRKRARLLAERCGTFVRHCVVDFDSGSAIDLRGVVLLLQQLARNPLLEGLTLRPSSCRILWPDVSASVRKRNANLPLGGTTDSASVGGAQPQSNSRNGSLSRSRSLRHKAFVDLLRDICQHSSRLQHLALGCIEELADERLAILEAVLQAQLQALPSWNADRDEPTQPCLRSVHVNSIRGDQDDEDEGDRVLVDASGGFSSGVPASGEPLAVPQLSRRRLTDLLLSFSMLRHISLDSDDVSDELLLGLAAAASQPSVARLESLAIMVHEPHSQVVQQQWLRDRAATGSHFPSNSAWQALCGACPELRVTLNMLHSFTGTQVLLGGLLQPAMPLAHFRSLFCGAINTAAITFMARQYCATLESVTVIEGMSGHMPLLYVPETEEDPFVMMAWKCNRLRSFALIGVAMLADDVVAIARLRGSQLQTLVVPDCCLMFIRDTEELDYGSHHSSTFVQQVTDSLGYAWRPLEYDELHDAVKSECADADTAYLRLFLSDQLPAWSHPNDFDGTCGASCRCSAAGSSSSSSSSPARHKLPSFGVAVPSCGVARQ